MFLLLFFYKYFNSFLYVKIYLGVFRKVFNSWYVCEVRDIDWLL